MTDFSSHDRLPPGAELRGGAYRIEESLGRGGFGVTYRATHLALNREVVVKEFFPQGLAERGLSGQVLPADSAERGYERDLARFLREAQTLAALSHPNIVRATDYFEGNGTGYLVMEFVGGRNLKHLLADSLGAGIPEGKVREIIGSLVDALEAVHAKGILHLDIKPENVLIPEDGRVLLIDFGGAKRVTPSFSTRIFTLPYAPPEMLAESIPLGPESDIFELGMMVHEMLTGELPPDSLSRTLNKSWESRSAQGLAIAADRRARPRS